MFWTVFTCKRCLICAYFSPDSYTNISQAILWIENSYFSQKQWFEVKNLLMMGFLVYYWDVFISHLDSHSDGTHSLQRIHWCASDAMLNFSKSMMKKQTLSWSEGEQAFCKFSFLGELVLEIKKNKRPCVTFCTFDLWNILCRCGDDVWMSVNELISLSVLFQHPLCVRRWWPIPANCWEPSHAGDADDSPFPETFHHAGDHSGYSLLHYTGFIVLIWIFHPQHMGIPQKNRWHATCSGQDEPNRRAGQWKSPTDRRNYTSYIIHQYHFQMCSIHNVCGVPVFSR